MPERKQHRLNPQEAKARLDGYFDGRREEIRDEIAAYEVWGSSVNISDGRVIRKIKL